MGCVNAIIVLSLGCVCLRIVLGSHFMGALFRFTTDPDVPNKATFYWRAGYVLGKGPCGNPCSESDIGQLGTSIPWPNDVYCHVGCTDAADTVMLAPDHYWIAIVNTVDQFEAGENEFTHTFASEGPFKVGLAGETWRTLSGPGSRGKWKVFTEIRFGVRSDTNRSNNSPVTTTFPLFKLQFDCDAKLYLPVFDPDGDRVRCRWGNTVDECGDACHGLPGARIDEESCSLEMAPDSLVADGWYVVAIVMEDFPNSNITMGGGYYTTTDALSLVPVQFLVRTVAYSTGCDVRPEFVEPTAEAGRVFNATPGQSVAILMFAVNRNSSASIAEIDIAGPLGVTTSPIYDDVNEDGVRYRVAFWTPTDSQSGTNIICFIARDTEGKSSEYRCVYVFANGVDECENSPCDTEDTFDSCIDGYCAPYSTCIDEPSSFTCLCPVGYTDLFCYTDINECDGNPCVNEGTCRDEIGYYVCDCVAGYEGIICEQLVDECNGVTCQNGGSCLNLFNDFYCICSPGYTGSLCELNIDDCLGLPCLNGGRCSDGVIGYTCTCTDGWHGVQCEDNIDECNSNPCLHNGTCVDRVDGYDCICDCTSGFTGLHCDIDIDECWSGPCVNGSCIDEVAQFRCQCEPGYQGLLCEHNINECTSDPCLNEGGCVDLINSYNCTCHPGYVGAHCETDFNECCSNPCVNGGICTDALNGYRCLCLDGFSGIDCETNIDDCMSVPCANNGSCRDLVSGYSCECQQHWYGDRCESTDAKYCFCKNEYTWSGIDVKVQCQCADDFTFSGYSVRLDTSAPCRRNLYVIVISVLAGAILGCIPLSVLHLVQDLKRRHECLLKGKDPDEVDKVLTIDRRKHRVSVAPEPENIRPPSMHPMRAYLISQGYGKDTKNK